MSGEWIATLGSLAARGHTTLCSSSHGSCWFRVSSTASSSWGHPRQQSENDDASPDGGQRSAHHERVVDGCSASSHLRIVTHKELVRARRNRSIAIGPSPRKGRGRLRDNHWNSGSRDHDADGDNHGCRARTPVATDRNDRHRHHNEASDQGNAKKLFAESAARSAAAKVVAVVARKDRQLFNQHRTSLQAALDAIQPEVASSFHHALRTNGRLSQNTRCRR